MRWRVKEVAADVFIVERKGGLWWTAAVLMHAWFDSFPVRYSDLESANAAMLKAKADYEFVPRVATPDGAPMRHTPSSAETTVCLKTIPQGGGEDHE